MEANLSSVVNSLLSVAAGLPLVECYLSLDVTDLPMVEASLVLIAIRLSLVDLLLRNY